MTYFQKGVRRWVERVFGPVGMTNTEECCLRFLEEALEFVQALGLRVELADRLVATVYGREVGEAKRELGGVMVTLARLSESAGLDMSTSGHKELARISTQEAMARIKQRSAEKVANGTGLMRAL